MIQIEGAGFGPALPLHPLLQEDLAVLRKEILFGNIRHFIFCARFFLKINMCLEQARFEVVNRV